MSIVCTTAKAPERPERILAQAVLPKKLILFSRFCGNLPPGLTNQMRIISKEILNKSSAAGQWIFCTKSAVWKKNLSPSALADFIRASPKTQFYPKMADTDVSAIFLMFAPIRRPSQSFPRQVYCGTFGLRGCQALHRSSQVQRPEYRRSRYAYNRPGRMCQA